MNTVIFSIISFIAGVLISSLYYFGGTDGVIEIDTSSPEKDRYLLVITEPIDTINNRKRLVLGVKRRDK